jgi:hypothetical protein
MKSFVKKHCNFCGEPMQESATVCKQCGWDRSQDGAPTADPRDAKARIGVALGLAVAYYVMFSLVNSADAGDRPPRPVATYDAGGEVAAPAYQAVTAQPIVLGALPPAVTTSPAAGVKPGKPLTIKVADSKSATVPARDALQYVFELPETDQKCQLVGQIRGVGGFQGNLETFLLTDDEYLFWHANPMAIPHSSWDTIRGSEATLKYQLTNPGTYHLVISNAMSPTPKTIQLSAQVKCTR